jgi:hypothetical protein
MKLPFNLYNRIDCLYKEASDICDSIKDNNYGGFSLKFAMQSIVGMLRAIRDNVSADYDKYDRNCGGDR